MSIVLRSLLILMALGRIQCNEEMETTTGSPEGDIDDEGVPPEEEGEMEEPPEEPERSLDAEMLGKLYSKFDANGDGKVSFQEIMDFTDSIGDSMKRKHAENLLGDLDTSKDGHMDFDEHFDDVSAAPSSDLGKERGEEEKKEHERRKAREHAKFKIADVNGDGKLDKLELVPFMFPETHDGIFSLMYKEVMDDKDLNKDGKLTVREFWGLNETESMPEDVDVKTLDTNSDGFVGEKELKTWELGRHYTEDAMKKLLELVDKDKDKHITKEELVEAAEKISEHPEIKYDLLDWHEATHDEM